MGMSGTFVPADNGIVFFGVTSSSSNTSLYINKTSEWKEKILN